MAKEYTVTNAFRQTVSKTDKTPKQFTSHDKVMWPWMVKVEGQDFWFQKNTLENGSINPGDTMYGIFDEEEVTANGKTFTVHKFIKVDRPDGSPNSQSSGNKPSPTGGAPVQNGRIVADAELAYVIELLEGIYPIVTGQELPARTTTDEAQASPEEESQDTEEDEDAPLNPSDLPY